MPAGHRAVIFDLDGLLIDTERPARRAFEAAARELGARLPEAVFPALVGRTARESDPILRAAFGSTFPLEALRIRTAEIYAGIQAREGIPVKPGAPELLRWLAEAGVPMALATSTARERALAKLAGTGLEGHFSAIVCGDEVTRGKPAPEPFLRAARRLQARMGGDARHHPRGDGLAPEQCVVLEDAPLGVRGAAAARMLPIWVPDLVPPDPETEALAHAVVPDLEAARPVLARLLAL